MENELQTAEDTHIEIPVETQEMKVLGLLETAIANGTDPDSLEKLLNMQERVLDKAAEQKFNEALRVVQSKALKIEADAVNDQTRSTYATLKAVNAKLKPVYTAEGFSLAFSEGETPKEDHIRVLCDMSHNAGFTKQYHADVPIDDKGIKGSVNKTRTHAAGSSFSYGRRYLTCMIFNIAIGEDDDGNAAGTMPELISDEQLADLEAKIEEYGFEVKKVCLLAKIDDLQNLPADKLEGLYLRLKEKYEIKQGVSS